MDWLERCDWSRRSAEFGELTLHGEHVKMEYVAPVPARLWELWRSLRAHPNILRADEPRRLRYAALDWTFEPVAYEHDGRIAERVATWGIVLARVYEFVIDQIGIDQLAWFCTPLVKVDLEGVLRIAFRSAGDKLPPETMDQWPICNERALVFAIGTTLQELVISPNHDTHLANIMRRCIERDPSRRYKSLGELRSALHAAGGRMVPAAGLAPARVVWSYIEEGLGLMAANQPTLALERRAGVSSVGQSHAICCIGAPGTKWNGIEGPPLRQPLRRSHVRGR